MVSFHAAKHNTLLRQDYLDSLDLGEYSCYVNTLKYRTKDTELTRIHEETAMSAVITSPELACQGMTGTPSDIKVYPSAFRWFVGSTEQNFISGLEHECRHAQQTYEAPEKFFPQLAILTSEDLTDEEKEEYTNRIVYLSEIDAYRFQLHRIFSKNVEVTNDMLSCLIEDLEDYCRMLE